MIKRIFTLPLIVFVSFVFATFFYFVVNNTILNGGKNPYKEIDTFPNKGKDTINKKPQKRISYAGPLLFIGE